MAVAVDTEIMHEPKQLTSDKSRLTNVLLLGLLGIALVAGVAYYLVAMRATKLIGTEYQAVLLDNGAAYFGKMVQSTGNDVVLQEVYYVQSLSNPETKQVSNVLIKRGKEWHGPDRMVINRQHLVFMEPVAPGSAVAKLIAESKR